MRQEHIAGWFTASASVALTIKATETNTLTLRGAAILLAVLAVGIELGPRLRTAWNRPTDASQPAGTTTRTLTCIAMIALVAAFGPRLLYPAMDGGGTVQIWRVAIIAGWALAAAWAARRSDTVAVSGAVPILGFGGVLSVHATRMSTTWWGRSGWLIITGLTLCIGINLVCAYLADRANRDRFARQLTAVMGVSLLVRVGAVLAWLGVEAEFGDPAYYHLQSRYLAHGEGFVEPFGVAQGIRIPTAFHPPLYSTYLAVGSIVGIDGYLGQKMMTVFASLTMVLFAGLIGRRIGGPTTGVIAALIVGLAPNLWLPDGLLWPEGLYTAATGAVIVAAYRWLEATRSDSPERIRLERRAAVVCGIALGVSSLIRGEALILAPILVVGLVWGARSIGAKRFIASLGAMALTTVVVLAPWTARNLMTFERPVLLSTNSDEVLYYANCADTYYGQLLGSWSYPCQLRDRAEHPGEEPQGEETVRVAYWRAKGIDFARNHLDRLPVVVAARIGRQFDLYRPGQNIELMSLESRPSWLSRIGQWWYWVTIPLAAIGWLRARRDRVHMWPITAQILTAVVTAAAVYGSIRFRVSADYALAIAAAGGITSCLKALGRGTEPRHPQP